MFSNLGLIFLAAGKSSRYGEKNKLLELYEGLPLFIHSIKKLSTLCKNDNIFIVCTPENINKFSHILNKNIPDNNFNFIGGGKERYNSVYNGLMELKDKVEYVAIHDTARPMATSKLLKNCYTICKKNGSAIAAKRINDTIKRTGENNKVQATIDRTNLWAIETPQVFRFNEIFDAYTRVIIDEKFITDDSSAMEYAGYTVYLMENTEPNKKVTYKTDLTDLV
jgi:2-C-methyl-D-erythritol 4-phosphate cytidylyltransferase